MTLTDPTLTDALKKGRIIRSRKCDAFVVTGMVSYRFLRGNLGYSITRLPDDALADPEPWIIGVDDLDATDWFIVSEIINSDLVDKIHAFRDAVNDGS